MEEHAFDEYIQVTRAIEGAVYNDFIAFEKDLASRDDTWKFRDGFEFHDCLAYVGLYLAIRGGSRWFTESPYGQPKGVVPSVYCLWSSELPKNSPPTFGWIFMLALEHQALLWEGRTCV